MSIIYSLEPINKTAGLVTSQSGCASDDTLTDEQLRENLVKQWKVMQEELKEIPKGTPERKEMGAKIQKVQDEINKIRPARKAKGAEQYFIDAAREVLSKAHFNAVMTRAVKMREFDNESTES